MDGFLRRLTPVVLIALAIGVWFESQLLGDVGVLRFTVGVLCFYTALLVLERQRMEVRFTQVLSSFKKFYEDRTAAKEGLDPQKGMEAVSILIAALTSAEAEVRESALLNLKRLTGKDFGFDSAAWQRWLVETRADSGDAGQASDPAVE